MSFVSLSARRSEPTENLILKTFEGDHEIQQDHFHRCLGQIVWITQFRGHVETSGDERSSLPRAIRDLPKIG